MKNLPEIYHLDKQIAIKFWMPSGSGFRSGNF